MSDVKKFALDLAERAGWTFVQAAGPILVGAQLTNWAEAKTALVAAGLAGAAAVLALVKGVAAGVRTGTASTSRVVAGPPHAVVVNLGVGGGGGSVAPEPTPEPPAAP